MCSNGNFYLHKDGELYIDDNGEYIIQGILVTDIQLLKLLNKFAKECSELSYDNNRLRANNRELRIELQKLKEKR